jgi:hypothetical protein
MDKFCIGEAAYHKLTCCPGGEELPRSYLAKQCKENLNKLCSIERTPGEANGAAFDFHDELSTVIEEMVSFILKYSYHMVRHIVVWHDIAIISELGPEDHSWPEAKVDLFTMFKHTYIHTYVHTYIRTYVHTYIRTYVHTYIRTYVHTYIRKNSVMALHLVLLIVVEYQQGQQE